MTEQQQYEGPPRTREIACAGPYSGDRIVVRAEYQTGGGVHLSAERYDGHPEEIWLSPEQWEELSRWHHGCRLYEDATTPPRVCAQGPRVFNTWCSVERIKLGDDWWPRVGSGDEVTCPKCLDDQEAWSE